MSIVLVVLILIAIGVGLYVVNNTQAIDGKFRLIINAVVLLATLFWLANVFGLADMGGHVGRFR